MMKKVIAAAIAAILCAAVISIPAFAAEITAETTDTPNTALTFTLQNDPAYTITIPAAMTLANDGAAMNITARDVSNLNGKKISVTIAGTDQYRNQMLLAGKTESGRNASIRYRFIKADNSTIETTGIKDEVVGTELASFTENGTASIQVMPIIENSSSIAKGVTYQGSITYGIELIDLA